MTHIETMTDTFNLPRVWFVESRFKRGKGGGWTEWTLLDPRQMLDECALLDADDLFEFEKELDFNDEFGEWRTQTRARMHPKFGNETFLLHGRMDAETEPKWCWCILSRDMPQEIHDLNDTMLTAMGI
jgi:hypothetical protein